MSPVTVCVKLCDVSVRPLNKHPVVRIPSVGGADAAARGSEAGRAVGDHVDTGFPSGRDVDRCPHDSGVSDESRMKGVGFGFGVVAVVVVVADGVADDVDQHVGGRARHAEGVIGDIDLTGVRPRGR